MNNNLFNPSMEAIDFQRDSRLMQEMSMQVAALQKDSSVKNLAAVSKALHVIAKKWTGVHYNFHFNRQGGINAFVLPPRANSSNPMASDEVVANVRRRAITEQDLFKGTIDIRTGKASGIYSKIPIDIFTAIEFFNHSAFEPEHIAAVMMHEMGHGFTYLRYLGKMTLGNVVASEIARRYHEGEGDKVEREIIRVVEQRTGWRLRDLGTLGENAKDPLVIQQIIMAQVVESIRSEMGTKHYDRRAFEFSSDQFVARHNGQKWIVGALDVMYRMHAPYIREYRGKFGNIMASLQSWIAPVLTATIAAVPGAAAAAGPIFIFGIAITLFSVLFGDGEFQGDNVYDGIEHRFSAMRRELIASSKDEKIPASVRRELIEQMMDIDRTLNHIKNHKGGYFGPSVSGNWIAGVVFGKAKQFEFPRTLENMVNNRLYETTNLLKTV